MVNPVAKHRLVRVDLPMHLDKLGTTINVDDFVVYPANNELQLGIVIKLNNKMIKVRDIRRKYYKFGKHTAKEHHRYSSDCAIIDSSAATMYILKITEL